MSRRRSLIGDVVGSGATGHRYWRLHPVEGVDGYSWKQGFGFWWHDVYNVELFTSPDATGLDLTEGKSAVASGEYGPSWVAGNILDAETEYSRWAPAWPANTIQWIYVDLGEPQAVHSMSGDWYQNSGFLTGPRNFYLQYSDNAVEWTNLVALATANVSGKQTFLDF